MTGKGIWTLVAALAVSSTPQDRPQFRASADLVQIDVSVQRNRRTVTGLTAADFELSDSGVAQRIERVTHTTLALDIVLAIDCSPSMAGGGTEWLTGSVKGMMSLKAPPDRIQVAVFSTVAKLVPLNAPIECDTGRAQGTAMFDAAIASMLLPTEGRKRVVVVLTDGAETTSLLPRQPRLQITDRSSALLYVIALTTDQAVRKRGTHMWILGEVGDVDWELRELAERTGGDLLAVPPKKDFVDTMRQALDDARLRYVIQYVPEGVPSSGWHEVEVKLKRPLRADVRAKRGYWR